MLFLFEWQGDILNVEATEKRDLRWCLSTCKEMCVEKGESVSRTCVCVRCSYQTKRRECNIDLQLVPQSASRWRSKFSQFLNFPHFPLCQTF